MLMQKIESLRKHKWFCEKLVSFGDVFLNFFRQGAQTEGSGPGVREMLRMQLLYSQVKCSPSQARLSSV